MDRMAKSAEAIKAVASAINPSIKQDSIIKPEPANPDLVLFFGMEYGKISGKEQEAFDNIADYMKRSHPYLTSGDSMLRLREISDYLGTPQIGEKQLYRVRDWLRLDAHIQEMKKKKSSLERGIFR